jgi:hypothetical protein
MPAESFISLAGILGTRRISKYNSSLTEISVSLDGDYED